LHEQTDDVVSQARMLANLGLNELRQGRAAQAAASPDQALELAREIGEQSIMVQARTRIGQVMLSVGRPLAALRAYDAALELACQLRELHAQASIHEGLGDTHHATGDPARARAHWQQAVALYSDLGVPGADQVRARIATAERLNARLGGDGSRT
jgi:tetratricopeptide (TPR) repeat protein